MKLHLSVEFQSFEEYLEFSGFFQEKSIPGILPESKPIPTPTKTATFQKKSAPVVTSKKSKSVAKVESSTFELPKIKNFIAPETMIQKVRDYVQKGKAFRTKDVVPSTVMSNPNRRARANEWLRAYPNLIFNYEKKEGQGGRGTLVYKPVQYAEGKMILSRGQKPTKSDWPIKGAAFKKAFSPIGISDDEEFTIADVSNN